MNRTPLNSADAWDSLSPETRDRIYDELIGVAIGMFSRAGAKVSSMDFNDPRRPLAKQLHEDSIHSLGFVLHQLEQDKKNGENPLPHLGFGIIDGAIVPMPDIFEDIFVAMSEATKRSTPSR